MLARSIDGISTFILIVLVSRYLSVADYGIYAFVMSYVVFLTLLAYGGIDRIAIHEFSVNRESMERYLWMVLGLTGALTAVFILICMLGLLFFDNSNSFLQSLLLAMAGQIFFSFSSISMSLFRAMKRMDLEIVLSIVFQLIMLAATYIVTKYNLGISGIFGAFALANFFRSLFAWGLCRMLGVRAVMVKVDWEELLRIIQKSFSLGVSIMLMQGILNMDVLLLRYLNFAEGVSFFYAAHNLMWKFNKAVPAAMAIAVFPILSAIISNSPADHFRKLYRKLFKLFYIPAIFASIGGVAYSSEIIALVYGEKYAVATDAFRVIMTGEAFVFVFMFLELVMISVERQNSLIISTALALTAKIVLSVLFIPSYGFIGSAVASLGGYVILTVVTFYYIRLSSGNIPAGDIIRPIGAAVPVGVFFYFSGVLQINPFIGLSVGAMIFAGMLVVFGSVSWVQLLSFKKMLSSKEF